MPRPTPASLSIVTPISRAERPKPPADLTPDQRRVWVTVTNGLPADWFRAETLPLLCQYVRHTTASHRLAALVEAAEQADPFDPKTYTELLRAQAKESAILCSLAVKLRISQSTTLRSDKVRAVEPITAPWEQVS